MLLAGFWSDVHPTTVLLVLAAVALALLVGSALSPAGQPSRRRAPERAAVTRIPVPHPSGAGARARPAPRGPSRPDRPHRGDRHDHPDRDPRPGDRRRALPPEGLRAELRPVLEVPRGQGRR